MVRVSVAAVVLGLGGSGTKEISAVSLGQGFRLGDAVLVYSFGCALGVAWSSL